MPKSWTEEIKYKFTAEYGKLKDSVSAVSSQLDKVSKAFGSTDRQMGAFSLRARNVSGSISLLGKTLGAITAIKLGDWFAQSMKQSISFVENLNLFNVAMGQSIDEGLKFVDTMSEVYGLDPSNIYRHAGYFYQLTDAIGMTDDASAALSLSLTKASNDIASLFNVDIETVTDNLASGMQGMSRAVRKYGMDIRAITLQETALTYGITQRVQNMSEADRMALRYLTMMNQVKNATSQLTDETKSSSKVMGDFARNIETPANQLRIFKEQITQLGRAIGNFFVPTLSKILPILNGIIMALRTILTYIASVLGIKADFGGVFGGVADTASDVSDTVSDIGDSAKSATKEVKKLKNTILGFDELNVLNQPSTSTSSSTGVSKAAGDINSDALNPKLLEAIKNMKLDLEDIKMKANKVRDAILEFLGLSWEDGQLRWYPDKFEANLIKKFPQWEKTIRAVFDNWTGIVDGFKNVFSALGEVVGEVINRFKEWVKSLDLDSKFAKVIEQLPDSLNGIADWIRDHKDQLADFIILLGKLYAGFKVFQFVAGFVAPIAIFVETIIGLAGAVGGLVGSISGIAVPLLAVVAVIALLCATSESFAESFKSLLSSMADTANNVWKNTFVPFLSTVMKGINNLMTLVKDFWNIVLLPLIEYVASSLPDLWSSTIGPIIEEIISIIGSLAEAIIGLFSHWIVPYKDYLVRKWGPTVVGVFKSVWDVVAQLVKDIGGIVKSLLGILDGITNFLAGVFTNDWSRAWQGIVKIFGSALDTLRGIVQAIVNVIISAINLSISFVWRSIQSWVNGIIDRINSISSLVGVKFTGRWSGEPPKIGYITVPKAYANGGFPEDGLFYANHNELVGEFSNGKTAVANNEQITKGIEEAAYRGFVRALSTVSGLGANEHSSGDVVFNVNGREFMRAIYSDLQAVSREKGSSLINNFA